MSDLTKIIAAVVATVALGCVTAALVITSVNEPETQPVVVGIGVLGAGNERVVDENCGLFSCSNVTEYLAPVLDEDGNPLVDGQGRQVLVADDPAAPSPGKEVTVYEARYSSLPYTTEQGPTLSDKAEMRILAAIITGGLTLALGVVVIYQVTEYEFIRPSRRHARVW